MLAWHFLGLALSLGMVLSLETDSFLSGSMRQTRKDSRRGPKIEKITFNSKTEDIEFHITGAREPSIKVKQLLPTGNRASHHRGPHPKYEVLQNTCSSCISSTPNMTTLHMRAVRTRHNSTWQAVAIRIFWELRGGRQVEYTGSYHTRNSHPTLNLTDSRGRPVPQEIIVPPTTTTGLGMVPTNSSASGITPSSLMMMMTLSLPIIALL